MSNVLELKDRMSHDDRLNAFSSKFGRKLRDEYLRHMAREADKQILIDTRCKIKRRKTIVTAGQRSINLDDDLLVPLSIRWKDPDDDALAEGIKVEIID